MYRYINIANHWCYVCTKHLLHFSNNYKDYIMNLLLPVTALDGPWHKK